jgi:ABC-type transporter Mla MlaB component
MLRISETQETQETTKVKLEGQMTGPWVAEAKRVCEIQLQAERRLIVDVEEVSFADSTGTALLRELAERGAVVTNCSPFLAQQVKQARSDS